MKYKSRVVELVRHYLITKRPVTEVDKSLGGWHYAENTDARNRLLEQSMNEIRDIITIADNLRNGVVDSETAVRQLNERFED